MDVIEEVLYRYNPWWEGGQFVEGAIERPVALGALKKSSRSKKVVFLTGLRRVGKSTLLKLYIEHLIKREGIMPRHIFYVSMDDYLLKKHPVMEIIDEYRKCQKVKVEERSWLFLDEITYKKDYEQQIKNIYDNQNAKVYASSSSASILRSRKQFLTGRNIIIELLPLDFEEYLLFKGIRIEKRNAHLVEKYFEEFLETGGLPEYVLEGNHEHVKELVDDIIQKDIASFHNIKNSSVLKDMFLLLMERSGKVVSLNKLARVMGISPDSASRYLNMFVDTFLVYLIQRDGTANERALAPRKLYASDLGIRNLFTVARDKGSRFENYIFLKIKHLAPRYIYKNGIELDFLTGDKTLIEVKYNSELTIKQRELFNATRARKKLIISNIDDLRLLP